MNDFAANLKEVNEAIDNDIEYKKELDNQLNMVIDNQSLFMNPSITVICDICNHEIHPHCNNANCEDGECWKDGMDFEDEE